MYISVVPSDSLDTIFECEDCGKRFQRRWVSGDYRQWERDIKYNVQDEHEGECTEERRDQDEDEEVTDDADF